MLLTPHGIREWGIATIVAVALSLLFLLPDWYPFPGWILVIPVAIGWFCVLCFFRDPIRRIPTDLKEGDMLSPADGTISAIETVDSHEATGNAPAIVIRIFLSVLNVHVNRNPCDATVLGTKHRPGRYLNAQTAESARVNESNVIFLENSAGEAFGLRQVSGMIARRIVCPLEAGDRLVQGHRFGMIKFGSTTELILPRPEDVTVHVEVGDSVRGVRTVLARLNPLP